MSALKQRTGITGRGLALGCAALLCGTAVAIAAAPGTPASGSPGALVSGFGNAAAPQSAGLVLGDAGSRYYAVAFQGDGKIVVAGQAGVDASPQLIVARYLPSGALDGSFGSGGKVSGPVGTIGRGIAIQGDGKIVVGGTKDGRFLAARMNTDGGLDGSFGSGGLATGPAATEGGAGRSVALAADGGVVVAGSATQTGGSEQRMTVSRFTSTGAVDGGFGDSGARQVLVNNLVTRGASVVVQSDGHIVVGGSIIDPFGGLSGMLTRLTATGTIEKTLFKSKARGGAAASEITSVANGAAGGLVVAGAAGNLSSSDFWVSRLAADGEDAGGYTTQWLAAPQQASVSRLPAPGAHAVLATPSFIYTAGIVDVNGIRLGGLSALKESDGSPVAGFGAAVGGDLQTAFGGANREGTTFTFVDGQSDNPTGGPMNEPMAIARAADGSRLAVAGISAAQLNGSKEPKGPRGFVAVYTPATETVAPPTGTTTTGTTTTTTPTTTPTTTTTTPTETATVPAPTGTTTPTTTTTTPTTPTTPKPPTVPQKVSGSKLTPTALRATTKAKLTFSLAKASTVKITVSEKRSGRKRSSGTCSAVGSSNRRGAKCTYYVTKPGSRTLKGKKGKNTVTITRTFGGRKLAKGTYRLSLKATGASARLVSFTVR
ncbi:hypothetical protein DSM112329_04912 [Paraconexibacter sp. AEG42_29]|uniref:Delta-60 repeat domain-containing protein n=1 Tax=Paraconexibacter sp. AEG42_29 TaxID=2997339 RepID=A0AAU7B330_9ACTN